MSLFVYAKLLVIMLLVSACSSVKTYESVANKSCGQNFCSEVEVENDLGKILVTDITGVKANLNSLELDAYCNFPMRKPLRSKHLGLVANTNESIDLVKREGFWEFSTSQIEEGCRFTISVTSKKIEEKFRFVALGKTPMGGQN
jgi:hypothetical protein